MIILSYINDSGTLVGFRLNDWEAAYAVAETIVKAPVEVDYLEYEDGENRGIFNLNTFERC